MLRLVRQRWAIENQCTGPRAAQPRLRTLTRYAQRNGVQVLALLRTLPSQLVALQRFPIDPRWPDGPWRMTSAASRWVGISLAETE